MFAVTFLGLRLIPAAHSQEKPQSKPEVERSRAVPPKGQKPRQVKAPEGEAAAEQGNEDEIEQAPPLKGRSANSVDATVKIEMDATRTNEGVLGIREVWQGLDADRVTFRSVGLEGEVTYENIRFEDGKGTDLGFSQKGTTYVPGRYSGETLVVAYDVRPGGLGRHGHQGYAVADYAVLDGRAFILPRGFAGTGRISLDVNLPDGWILASPFREEDGHYYMDWWGDAAAPEVLIGSCFGVGPWQAHEQAYGDSTLRVFTFGPWEDDHEQLLVDKTNRMFRYFAEAYGYSAGNGAPYAVVWTPQPSEENRLFGGSSASGACFEQPTDRFRNWQLLGHRFGHAMNKYVPLGYTTAEHRDHWYIEGWASWSEIEGTEKVGITDGDTYYNELYRRYLANRENGADEDIPLADEGEARGDLVEYLHYTKAPLVVELLDLYLQANAQKSLTDYTKHVTATYGSYQRALPLREDLEAWAGIPLDDFWAAYVDQVGAVPPAWDGYLTEQALSRPAPSIAATVGEMPVSGDYLYYLARRGGFETFSEIRDFLESEQLKRAQLQAAGIKLASDQVYSHLDQVDPAGRYHLALAEQAWPLRAAAPSGGCWGMGGGSAPAKQDLALNASDEDGQTFAALLEAEKAYKQIQASEGINGVAMKSAAKRDFRTTPDVLAIEKDERVVLVTDWGQLSGEADFEVIDGDRTVFTKGMSLEPGWTRTWSTFDAKDRPRRSGVVYFRVRDQDRELIRRAFWQR